MDESPPQEGTGHTEVGAQAERSVDSQGETKHTDRNADIGAVPESNQSAGKTKQPSENSGQNNNQLSSKETIFHRIARSEFNGFWTLAATVALALATFVLALSTADMARSTRELARLAGQQAKDTQDALDASRRQAKAAETANRLSNSPQVSVAAVNMPVPRADKKFSASYSIFDAGRAPANNVFLQSKMVLVAAPQMPQSLPACVDCGQNILFPAQGYQGSTLISTALLNLSQEDVDKIKNKATYLYLLGRVDYLDPDAHAHTITICTLYNADLDAVGPCTFGNSAD